MQKEMCVKALETLKVFKPYIKGFREKDQVCFYENYGGFWVEQEAQVYEKMKEIESKYKCRVYAITHEYTSIGEMWDFLIMSEHEEEWDYTIEDLKNGYAFAYVWNKSDEDCSEFGTICVKSFGGGIKRVG
jgi:hypothetical protein